MPRDARTLRELARIRADNHQRLAGISMYTALGRKNFDPGGRPTGAPAVIAYVHKKRALDALPPDARIPSMLQSADGTLQAPTDVVETAGMNVAGRKPPPLTAEAAALTARLSSAGDLLFPGCRLGFARIRGNQPVGHSGTLGCAVRGLRDPRWRGFLTNQHVGREPGLSLYHPSYRRGAARVGMVRETLQLVADERWIRGVDEPDAFIVVDAALVEARPAWRDRLRSGWPVLDEAGFRLEPLGPPLDVDLDALDTIGLSVKKVGQRSGVRRGVIVAVGLSRPAYGQGIDQHIGHAPARFYADLVIAPDDGYFSAGGDSGALVVTAEGLRPVGLLWGGGASDLGRGGIEAISYATSLQRVLDAFGVVLL